MEWMVRELGLLAVTFAGNEAADLSPVLDGWET
jgi:hypothetical protein